MKATAQDIDFYDFEISKILICMRTLKKNMKGKVSPVDDSDFTQDDLILEHVLVRIQVAMDSLSSATGLLRRINEEE